MSNLRIIQRHIIIQLHSTRYFCQILIKRVSSPRIFKNSLKFSQLDTHVDV
jgi:hypothetical protein